MSFLYISQYHKEMRPVSTFIDEISLQKTVSCSHSDIHNPQTYLGVTFSSLLDSKSISREIVEEVEGTNVQFHTLSQ